MMRNIFVVEDSPIIRDELIISMGELVGVQLAGVAEDEAHALGWFCDPGNAWDDAVIDPSTNRETAWAYWPRYGTGGQTNGPLS